MKNTRCYQRQIVSFVLSLCFLILCLSTANAQVPLLGLGDSIGEGVQSADASWRTQLFSYLKWLGHKMEVSFPSPLIQTGLFGVVGDTEIRSRLDPSALALKIAVSGANVNSLLNDRTDATTEDEINSETDLVIFPRLGS